MHKEVPTQEPLPNLLESFASEEKARAYLEAMRWPDGPACPRPNCDSTEVMRFKSRPIFKCKKCQRQFSVTVGTIFEDSHIPLRTWLHTIYLMCSSKKGISAHQIHRMLGITYKSAWFMCHRVRLAMSNADDGGLFAGEIEADETYVGGRPRRHPSQKRGTMAAALRDAATKKVPVLGDAGAWWARADLGHKANQ